MDSTPNGYAATALSGGVGEAAGHEQIPLYTSEDPAQDLTIAQLGTDSTQMATDPQPRNVRPFADHARRNNPGAALFRKSSMTFCALGVLLVTT